MSVRITRTSVVWAIGSERRVIDMIQGADRERVMRNIGHDWVVTTREKDGNHFIVFTDPRAIDA